MGDIRKAKEKKKNLDRMNVRTAENVKYSALNLKTFHRE